MKFSLIYRSVGLYRFAMNLLYQGRYRDRFDCILAEIDKLQKSSKVVELCFGDVIIANHCRNRRIQWVGYDINEVFVRYANDNGFEAILADLEQDVALPKADVAIMVGSLYHFLPNPTNVLARMLECSKTVIISEPVKNLSSRKDLIGFVARRAARAGKGNEERRFDEKYLMDIINYTAELCNCSVVFTRLIGKDLIFKLVRNERD